MDGERKPNQVEAGRSEGARVPFGTLLRTYRIAAQLSQETLAERSRMSVDAISALERGARRAPRRDTVALLLEALHLGDAQRIALETAAADARPSRPRLETPARNHTNNVDRQSQTAHNLPFSLTTFYGREDELRALLADVVERRLTTITGAGGVGKTRLAIEAAWKLLDRFPDGVHLVELAPLGDGDLVSSRIAAAFGLPAQTGQLAGDLWIDALRDRQALLVLDNCEHVLEPVCRTTERLLQRCPDLRVLATSREALRIPGERVLRLQPLALAAVNDVGDDRGGRNGPAISLFLDRVSDTLPDYKLLDDDVAGWRSVANVCTKLDGIPLALELAAARVCTLGLPTLERGLDDRFRLLRGGARTSLPRQQTLQATLDWSYAVLDEDEQRVFDRLGVFTGSFTADAARAVCADNDVEPDEVADILWSLFEKSLVVAVDVAPTTRYRLLETTRAYALDRLENDGGLVEARRKHAEHYHALSDGSRTLFGLSSFAEWAETYAQELDNFRAALVWTIDERGDVMLGASILWNLRRLLEFRSLEAEGISWCNRALAAFAGAAPPAVEAQIHMIVSRLLLSLGVYHDVIPAAGRAVELYRSIGAELQLAYALTLLARGLCAQPEFRQQADVAVDEALAIFAQSEQRPLVDIEPGEGEMPRLLMNMLANSFKAFTIDQTDYARRRALLRASYERCRVVAPGHFLVSVALLHMSEVELDCGDYEAAMRYANQSLDLYRGPGSSYGYIWALNAAATSALAVRDIETGRRHAAELLAMTRRLGSAPGLAMALLLLSTIAGEDGDAARAGGLFGAWDSSAGKTDVHASATAFLSARAHELLARTADDALLATDVAAGSRWSIDQAIDVALQVAERRP